jgi:hypothetical protein
MKLIATTTLTSGAAEIQFNSITPSYTDLLLVISPRTNQSVVNERIFTWFSTIASVSPLRAGYDMRTLRGDGSSVATSTTTVDSQFNLDTAIPGATSTANTFGSIQIYYPNYSTSQSKNVSVNAVSENNSGTSGQLFLAGTNQDSNALSPITNIACGVLGANNFVTGTTASLYGILKGSDGITTAS